MFCLAPSLPRRFCVGWAVVHPDLLLTPTWKAQMKAPDGWSFDGWTPSPRVHKVWMLTNLHLPPLIAVGSSVALVRYHVRLAQLKGYEERQKPMEKRRQVTRNVNWQWVKSRSFTPHWTPQETLKSCCFFSQQVWVYLRFWPGLAGPKPALAGHGLHFRPQKRRKSRRQLTLWMSMLTMFKMIQKVL